MEKEKFEEFSRADGQQDLYDYCNRPRRNILEVLHDFRHTTPNIPLDYLFDLIPGAMSYIILILLIENGMDYVNMTELAKDQTNVNLLHYLIY